MPNSRNDDYANGPDTTNWLDVPDETSYGLYGGFGWPSTGEIEVGDDTDWFAVLLRGGNTYAFDLEGSATDQGTLTDPLLQLHDANGEVVAMDDDSGEGLNSRIVFTPDQDGTCYLDAGSYGDNTGTYTLTASVTDLADNANTIGWIDNYTPASGEIEVGDDTDWFGIWLSAGNEYVFDLEGAPTDQGTLSDPILYLHDADGEVVTMDDDSGEGLNSRIVFTPEEDGTYYLDAGSWGDNTGTYTLTASMDDDPGDDFANGPETTSWVGTDAPTTGEIENGDDTDWFAVWLEEGIEYSFDLEGSPTGQGTLADTYLSLADWDGDIIEVNDDGGEGRNSHITFTPQESDVYYLAAGSYGSNTGTYTLSVEALDDGDDYADGIETHGWLNPGSNVSGEIENGNDTDWFAIWMEAGHEYQIDLEGNPTGQGSLPDTYLSLADWDGDIIETNDDGGVWLNSRITFVPEESDVYYLVAGSYGSNTGTYTLSATDMSDMWL